MLREISRQRDEQTVLTVLKNEEQTVLCDMNSIETTQLRNGVNVNREYKERERRRGFHRGAGRVRSAKKI